MLLEQNEVKNKHNVAQHYQLVQDGHDRSLAEKRGEKGPMAIKKIDVINAKVMLQKIADGSNTAKARKAKVILNDERLFAEFVKKMVERDILKEATPSRVTWYQKVVTFFKVNQKAVF